MTLIEPSHKYTYTVYMKYLISKTYIKRTYSRVHISAREVLSCISIVYNIVILCMRLPFGTSPDTLDYTTIRKMVMEITNNLLLDMETLLHGLASQDKYATRTTTIGI